jgi:hypothetical protein
MMKKILSLSVRCGMKEAVEKDKVQKQQVKQIKNTLREIETREA